VVDLFKLQPESKHPHGLADRDFDVLFTTDKPIIFNFHGYPWLIHKLSYRFTNHANLHVRGYKEKGNINTPLELAMNNQIDRFSLAIDVIDRVPKRVWSKPVDKNIDPPAPRSPLRCLAKAALLALPKRHRKGGVGGDPMCNYF